MYFVITEKIKINYIINALFDIEKKIYIIMKRNIFYFLNFPLFLFGFDGFL